MDTEYFKNLLRKRSLKATSPRLSLLAAMEAYDSAMPYSAIQKEMKSMDRVTLYRTLEVLKTKGIIHKAYQETNETYYAICGNDCSANHHHDNHIHLKCTKCDTVSCQDQPGSLDLDIPGFNVSKVSINVEGICKQCE